MSWAFLLALKEAQLEIQNKFEQEKRKLEQPCSTARCAKRKRQAALRPTSFEQTINPQFALQAFNRPHLRLEFKFYDWVVVDQIAPLEDQVGPVSCLIAGEVFFDRLTKNFVRYLKWMVS